MHKDIKWANKELKGLSHDDLAKIKVSDIVRSENGKLTINKNRTTESCSNGGKIGGLISGIKSRDEKIIKDERNDSKKKNVSFRNIEPINGIQVIRESSPDVSDSGSSLSSISVKKTKIIIVINTSLVLFAIVIIASVSILTLIFFVF